MAEVWPEGKGRIGGRCTSCYQGVMELRFSCRFVREYVCTNCGTCSSTSGRHENAPLDIIRTVIDDTYKELAPEGETLDLRAFLITVEAILHRRFGKHVPPIRRVTLEAWGYNVWNDCIRRHT